MRLTLEHPLYLGRGVWREVVPHAPRPSVKAAASKQGLTLPSPKCVRLPATSWTAARQVSLPSTVSRALLWGFALSRWCYLWSPASPLALSGWNSLQLERASGWRQVFRFSLWSPSPSSRLVPSLDLLWSPSALLNCQLLAALLSGAARLLPQARDIPQMHLQAENTLF